MNEGARQANDSARHVAEREWREAVLRLLRQILTELRSIDGRLK